ncbi:MAG: hypothetical protein JWO15_2312 [Sphingomonadales bacterium]|nr:hypothetical protein [Sphingomonadales bacterium]
MESAPACFSNEALVVHDLIQTKTAPPSWMGDKIRRDGLLARLDGGLHKRLTLIHAPAGYGKTSLLVQWRRRHRDSAILVAWLTLEKDDAHLRRLTDYISLAIGGPETGAAQGDDASYMQADLPPRAALSAIINRLVQETRPVVLIFDDFHCAASATVVEFVKSLIRLAPENCHFVIASRDYPLLDQAVLAAENQLLDIRTEDLRFSASETEALFARNENVTVDSDDLRRIFERTEGWPIALQLTSLSLRPDMDHQQLVDRLGGSSAELASYLSEQVLMGLPPDMRELVIRTALVDTLTGDMVNALCDRQDGWLMLEHLEQQGVFLTSPFDDRHAYRYHQLFAENMRDRLARHDIAKFCRLQCAAAQWFAAHDDIVQAINHAIQAQNPELLVTIFEDAGAWRLIPNGMQGVAERAIGALPCAIVEGNPRLVLTRIYLAIKRGEMAEARANYDRLSVTASDANLSADLLTEIHIVEELLLEYENVPVTLEGLLAREALLRTLPTNDHLMLGNVCESLGAKYYESGRLERAMEPTLAARDHYQARGSLYSDLFTRFLESRIRHDQGRLKDSLSILATARIEIESTFGDRSDLAANCAAFEAQMLYAQDRLPEATALLLWSLPHMEQSDGWVDVYAAAYMTAARIAAADGLLDDARALLSRARRLARRRRLPQLELLAQLCELHLLIQNGHCDEAAFGLAHDLALDALADDMLLESPIFRPVATAAALCRARLYLVDGRDDLALAQLDVLKTWGSQHGSGGLLIEVNILIACALQTPQAQSHFDEAVGMAMFQGIVRPFLDARRFVEPLVKATLRGTQHVDRFRDQFLKELSRSFASTSLKDSAQGPLTTAETTVLTYLCQGYSNKEIARFIRMSPDTVKYRLKSLFKKLGVSKRRDAVSLTRDRNLIADTAWSHRREIGSELDLDALDED